MKNIKICILLVFCVIISILKPTNIIIEPKEVQKVSVSCSNNKVMTDKSTAIWTIAQFLKMNPFFESDIEQLQSSPEKFITIWLKDETSIKISSVGIYSLVTHQRKTNTGIEILNSDIYITNFLMTNLIYYLTKIII